MTERLTRSDWINHGFRTLVRFGPSSLKAAAMAEALKVSRGSFYWHFADMTDYRAALLSAWQAQATDEVITAVESGAGPDRLKLLLQRAFSTPPAIDRAMRNWATLDKTVAAAIAANDAKRIAYIADLLTATGLKRGKAESRATFLYWAFIGRLMATPRTALPAGMLDDITRMFES